MRIETNIADLTHEGVIHAGLDGAFYRVYPDPQFPPRLGDAIAFNGDGMIARYPERIKIEEFLRAGYKAARDAARQAIGRTNCDSRGA
ncbi:MAG: carotenoid oxygenase family protein [Sphingomicrobium sp.]